MRGRSNEYIKKIFSGSTGTRSAHGADFSNLLAGVYRLEDPNTGQDTLRFEGTNVQIVNGTGATKSADGTGNLIIGYNETREEDPARVCHAYGNELQLAVGKTTAPKLCGLQSLEGLDGARLVTTTGLPEA